jgi:hypothetical protein
MSLYAADGGVKLRRAQSLFMLSLCSVAALLGIAVLGLVLYFLAARGLSHLNLKLFTVASGDGDGIAQSVRGTLQILAVACARFPLVSWAESTSKRRRGSSPILSAS